MHKAGLSILLLSSIFIVDSLASAKSTTKSAKTKQVENSTSSKTVVAKEVAKSTAEETKQNQINRISGEKSTMAVSNLEIKVKTAAPEGAPLVNKGQVATVNYTGWLWKNGEKNGKPFDSSKNPGRTPFQFNVGGGMVIKGWDQGLQQMQVGGTYELIIPSELGYGARGAGGAIPGNADLIFEIEVLKAQ